jgi:hypothetical protein
MRLTTFNLLFLVLAVVILAALLTPSVSARSAHPNVSKHGVVVLHDFLGGELWRHRCYFAGDYLVRESCDEQIAQLRAGDRVKLLSGKIRAADGSDIYKVQFGQWIGWMDSVDLRIE